MAEFKNPYISRVQIKNFRNFLDVDVYLDHKQVIIGENNVGKTNFLKALQLILDRDLSDNDRQLTEEDFHDSIEDPIANGTEIEIIIQIKGYEHNNKLKAQFDDAVVSTTPPTIQLGYRYFPNKDENGDIINYTFKVYKGTDLEKRFGNEDRNFINIYIIKALRDVERELKAGKKSPLYKLVKQYDIAKEKLEEISESLKKAADGILELDEIVHIKESLKGRFSTLSGLQYDNEITLRTFDIDTERLLYTLQVYMGVKERPVAELSLGLSNILYVSLMLILLKDRTIPPLINEEKYNELVEEDEEELIASLYEITDNGNYLLKKDISKNNIAKLYSFMDEHNYKFQPFTILAVEEPESHLHPSLQRLIYREVLHNSDTSVIFTSHSPFITSVTPLNSIVHIRKVEKASKVFSTAKLTIDQKNKRDIERYIDAKRGEIYFGKAIVLVEGITEEYIVPASAKLLDMNLDDYGIVVCNIDSTNFKPYIQILNILNIPWVTFTDGDYYEIEKVDRSKRFHIMASEEGGYYRGNQIAEKILVDLNILSEKEIPHDDYSKQDELFNANGFFIGKYTLEVDMMETADEEGLKIFKEIFAELVVGGAKMKENFNNAIDDKDYWNALKKIEDYISKGRFAQRFSNSLTTEFIPEYIENGLTYILAKIKSEYE